jgi:hypothetical protein
VLRQPNAERLERCDHTCRFLPNCDMSKLTKFQGQTIGQSYFALIIQTADPQALVVVSENVTTSEGSGESHQAGCTYRESAYGHEH